MTTTEKAAYLRGLVEGQVLDPEAGEGKLWHVLSELVSDLAAELTELRKDHENLADSLEEVQVGLDYLEELFQEEYEGFDGDEEYGEEDYYPFGQNNFRVVESEEDEVLEEPDEEDEDGIYYEVECPNCGEEISFDDETLEEGSIICPNCGAALEFDLQSPDEDEGSQLDDEPEDDGDMI